MRCAEEELGESLLGWPNRRRGDGRGRAVAFLVEKTGGWRAAAPLMSWGLVGGVSREVARLRPEVSFNHMQARDGELIWNLDIWDGRSSILRLTDGDPVFDDSLAFAVAPHGVVVARSTGE